MLPFLVFLVTKWGGNALIYGLMGATYSAFQLVGAPILGRWSDRFGRRKILFLSQLGTLISWLIFLMAFLLPVTAIAKIDSNLLGQFTITVPLIILFLARAADGITGGNVSVANAYLADITDEDHRNENFGRMAISGNLGFILGPALAGLLGATVYGEILPVVAALSISFIATLIILFGLKEVSACTLENNPEQAGVRKVFGQEHKECYRIKGAGQTPLGEILKLQGVAVVLTIYFLVMLGFSVFYVAFPIHAVTGLQWSVTDTGAFFVVLSVLMAISQGPVLSAAAKRFSDTALIVAGSLILSVGFAFLVGSTKTLLYVAAAFIALGNGLMWPSVLAVLSKIAGDRYQGAVQGIAGSAGAVASIIGLVLGGLMYNGITTITFVVSAAIIFLVTLVAVVVGEKPWQDT